MFTYVHAHKHYNTRKCVSTFHNWIKGRYANSTLVVLVSRHLNVAVISPIRSQRVLDEPVVLTIDVTISYNQYAMVWPLVAFWLIEHPCKTGFIMNNYLFQS